MIVRQLTTEAELADARELLKLVFGGSPRIRREDHQLYGIYRRKELVAITATNTNTLQWHATTVYAAALKTPPEAAISFTAVRPAYRQKGYATALRLHIQGIYKSLVTGTGAKSNIAAMHRLNQNTGFRILWHRGKCTVWYWTKPRTTRSPKVAADLPATEKPSRPTHRLAVDRAASKS